MPKICYVEKNFGTDAIEVIDRSNIIIEDYEAQGFDLTLRQIYYVHVSKGWIENTERSYKRLGCIINDARMAGLIDWERITDRTRNLRKNPHWDSPDEIIRAAADSFAVDKWADQETRCEVWIEKDVFPFSLAEVIPASQKCGLRLCASSTTPGTVRPLSSCISVTMTPVAST